MSDAHREEIEKLESLYAQNPEGRIFTHLAEAYRKAGSLEQARDVLAAGIERHPDYSSAHVVLGRVLHDLGQHGRARAEFLRVLELDGQNLVALRSLGDIARNEGRDEEALKYYQRLADQEPADDEVRAIIEVMTGVAEEAPPAHAPEGASAEAAPVGEAAAPPETAPEGAPAPETAETVPAPELEPLEEDWEIDEAAGAEWETVEEPGGWEPVFDEPSDDEPAHEQPPHEEPAYEEPAYEQPGSEEPAYEEPVYEEPSPEQPAYEQPGYEQPGYEQPVSDEGPGEPGYGEPVHEEGEPEPASATDSETPSAEESAEDDWEQWDEWGFEDEASEVGAESATAGGAEEPAEPHAAEPETAWWEPEPEAEGPAGEDDVPEAEEIEDADVKTETIAQVYARQGLYDRAVEVYQELIRSRPEDEGLRARLAELQQLAGESGQVDSVAGAPEPEVGPEAAGADEVGAEAGDWARNEYVWKDEWSEPRGGEAEAQEAGAMEAEGGAGEIEAEREPWEETPAPESPEGFEAAEFAPEPGPDVAPIEGFEAEDVSADTGLVVTPEEGEAGTEEVAAAPADELEAGPAEEPPAQEPAPWEVTEEEPYAEERDEAAGEPVEEAAHESPWVVEEDWSDEAQPETPYAWAEEEAEAEDGTPPIHDYLSGVLRWEGGANGDVGTPAFGEVEAAGPESAGAAPEPEAPGAEGAPDQAGADTADAEPGSGGDGGAGSDQDGDDDDLEMFRSWLESLKE